MVAYLIFVRQEYFALSGPAKKPKRKPRGASQAAARYPENGALGTLAGGSQGAIERVRNRSHEIDLVILDLVMPGMDGVKVFDKTRQTAPGLPVILSSSYAVNGRATRILGKECNGFIEKLFNFTKLSHKSRSVLDGVDRSKKPA